MLKNLTIGVRLTLGFGLLAALLLGVAALAYLRIQDIDSSVQTISRVNLPKVEQAHAAIDQVNVTARAIRNAMLLKNSSCFTRSSCIILMAISCCSLLVTKRLAG